MAATTGGQSDAIATAAPELFAEVLRRFGEAWVRVSGTSMLPAVSPRDVLLVHRCSIERVKAGDIVLFAVGCRLFAHRVVQTCLRTQAPFLITKGDTHRRADPPVSSFQFLGQVVAASNEKGIRRQPFAHSRCASACSILTNGCVRIAAGVKRAACALVRLN